MPKGVGFIEYPAFEGGYETLKTATKGFSELEPTKVLSTLRKTVQAMGGTLSLVAEFPDRPPVALSGIAEDDPTPKPAGRKNARAHFSRLVDEAKQLAHS